MLKSSLVQLLLPYYGTEFYTCRAVQCPLPFYFPHDITILSLSNSARNIQQLNKLLH